MWHPLPLKSNFGLKIKLMYLLNQIIEDNISGSSSHIASSTPRWSHKTITNGIVLLQRCLSWQSNICIGISSYDIWSSIYTSGISSTWVEVGSYFLNMETWNTSCTSSNEADKDNWYATRPILSVISNVLVYLGACFPVFPNLVNLELIFKNT